MLNQNPRETPSGRSSPNQWSVQHGRDLRQGKADRPVTRKDRVRRGRAFAGLELLEGRTLMAGAQPSSRSAPARPGPGRSTSPTSRPTAGRSAACGLDLTGAILPDVAFDPNGAAGDTAGKPFTVDGTTPVGLVGHALSGPHDGGYDALEINFNGFDPGETFNFSIDVDPTSIRGVAPSGPRTWGTSRGWN